MATTTLVAVGGKGSNPKTILYVGGLDECVNETSLHAAFIPFGDIKDVNIPLDNKTGKHRGFGFVEYEERDDAAAAVDNMHNGELFGRVLKVRRAGRHDTCMFTLTCHRVADNLHVAKVISRNMVHIAPCKADSSETCQFANHQPLILASIRSTTPSR